MALNRLSPAGVELKSLVVLTGGSSGVGRALLGLLLENNYFVLNVSRRKPVLPGRQEHQFYHVSCDLSKSGFHVYLGKELSKFRFADFDLKGYIHCAGIGQISKLSDLTFDEIESTIGLNLTSALVITKMLVPLLHKGSSKICFLGSRSRRFAFSGGAAYSSSKAGLFSAIDSLALEFKESKWNIGVSIFEFGTIGTGFGNIPITNRQISAEGAADIIFRSFSLPLSDYDLRVVEVVPSVERLNSG